MAEPNGDSVDKDPDPRVTRLRPDPSQPAPRVRALVGWWGGDSDRSDRRRLYLTSALDVYAEFRVEDVMSVTEIPAGEAPFRSEAVTRVELRHDAPVDITHTRQADEIDEFDIDVRLGAARFAASARSSATIDHIVLKAEDNSGVACESPCHTSLFAPPCNDDFGPVPGTFNGCPLPSDGCPTSPLCHTDHGHTQCGTCYTDVAETRCGTCTTEVGQTRCGGCERWRARR